jgi:hypothetical protein
MDKVTESVRELEFEKAALLRDPIKELKRRMGGDTGAAPTKPVSYGKKTGSRKPVRRVSN